MQKRLVHGLRGNSCCCYKRQDWINTRVATDGSKGCEVSIELPKKWYKYNDFLGFALLFHFVHLPPPHDYQTRYDSPYYSEFSISQGDQFIHVKALWLNFNFINYWKHGLEALGVSFFPQIGIQNEYRSIRWIYFKAIFGCKSYSTTPYCDYKALGQEMITQQKMTHSHTTKDEDNMSSSFPS